MKLELLKKLKGKMPATESADPMLEMEEGEAMEEEAPSNPALAKVSDEELLAECRKRGLSVETAEEEALEEETGLEA